MKLSIWPNRAQLPGTWGCVRSWPLFHSSPWRSLGNTWKQGRAAFIASWVIWCLGVKWGKARQPFCEFFGDGSWQDVNGQPSITEYPSGLFISEKHHSVSTACCLSRSGAEDGVWVQREGKLITCCENILGTDSSSVLWWQEYRMVWTQVTDWMWLSLDSDDYHSYIFYRQS